MTAKQTKKNAKTDMKSRRKPSAAVKTEPAPPILSAGGPPEPCAAAGVSEASASGTKTPSAAKRVFGIAVYALAFFMALQLIWGGVRFAGRAVRLYRQFSQFREWEWDGDGFPIPHPDGDSSNIKKYIRKNFARSIPAKERDAAAQIFGEAADRAADGTLINRDDALGFLGENLKPVCRAPAWVPLLTGLWTEMNLAAGATPAEIEKACRAVADALSEVALVPEPGLAVFGSQPPAVAPADATVEDEEKEEPEPAPVEEKAEPEPAAEPAPDAPTDGSPAAVSPVPDVEPEPVRNCPGGSCPVSGNCPDGNCPVNGGGTYYQNAYGGYGWRWMW